MRIEHCELTFLNLPTAPPELWALGRGVAEINVWMGPEDRVVRGRTRRAVRAGS